VYDRGVKAVTCHVSQLYGNIGCIVADMRLSGNITVALLALEEESWL